MCRAARSALNVAWHAGSMLVKLDGGLDNVRPTGYRQTCADRTAWDVVRSADHCPGCRMPLPILGSLSD
jgi:hypothetical protein